MMKRIRTMDAPKHRRAVKVRKNESLYLSSHNLVYLKFVLIWLGCITLDFVGGFRFELFWPVWLLVRHLIECYRSNSFSSNFHYSGQEEALKVICCQKKWCVFHKTNSLVLAPRHLDNWLKNHCLPLCKNEPLSCNSAFSVFFVCITATSDLVCFLFIPMQVLIFVASTYVWVQFVYHSSDRGICLPSLLLWALFIVFEYSMRHRFDNATWSFTSARSSWISSDNGSSGMSGYNKVDYYRPLAAHCLGFPVVMLGFRVKSYFSKWCRRLRTKEVKRQNVFFERLLAEAVPTSFETRQHFITTIRECDSSVSRDNGTIRCSAELGDNGTRSMMFTHSNYNGNAVPLAIYGNHTHAFAINTAVSSSSSPTTAKKIMQKFYLNKSGISSCCNNNGGSYNNHNNNNNNNNSSSNKLNGQLIGLSGSTTNTTVQVPTNSSVIQRRNGSVAKASALHCNSTYLNTRKNTKLSGESSSPHNLPLSSNINNAILNNGLTNNNNNSGGSSNKKKTRRSRGRTPAVSSDTKELSSTGYHQHHHSNGLQQQYANGIQNEASNGLTVHTDGVVCSPCNGTTSWNSGANQSDIVSSADGSMNNATGLEKFSLGSGNESVGNSSRENLTKSMELKHLYRDKEMLETTIEKLSSELKGMRSEVLELRTQLSQVQQQERIAKGELVQYKAKLERSESRCKQMSKQNEHMKTNISAFDKRINELQLRKLELERELANNERHNASLFGINVRHHFSAKEDVSIKPNNYNEFGGSQLKSRVVELEHELKAMRREVHLKDEVNIKNEEELRQLRLTNVNKQSNEESFLKKYEILRQKNFLLEQTLSSENRLKQDLFRALNDSKAQIEELNGRLRNFEHKSDNGINVMNGSTRYGDDQCEASIQHLQNYNKQQVLPYFQMSSSLGSYRSAQSVTPPPMAVTNALSLEQLMQTTGAQHMPYPFLFETPSNHSVGNEKMERAFDNNMNGKMNEMLTIGSQRTTKNLNSNAIDEHNNNLNASSSLVKLFQSNTNNGNRADLSTTPNSATSSSTTSPAPNSTTTMATIVRNGINPAVTAQQ